SDIRRSSRRLREPRASGRLWRISSFMALTGSRLLTRRDQFDHRVGKLQVQARKRFLPRMVLGFSQPDPARWDRQMSASLGQGLVTTRSKPRPGKEADGVPLYTTLDLREGQISPRVERPALPRYPRRRHGPGRLCRVWGPL